MDSVMDIVVITTQEHVVMMAGIIAVNPPVGMLARIHVELWICLQATTTVSTGGGIELM